jgi:hypothetical protein
MLLLLLLLLPLIGIFSIFGSELFSQDVIILSVVVPVAVYPDAAAAKEQILKDNKGKAGVYLIFFC